MELSASLGPRWKYDAITWFGFRPIVAICARDDDLASGRFRGSMGERRRDARGELVFVVGGNSARPYRHEIMGFAGGLARTFRRWADAREKFSMRAPPLELSLLSRRAAVGARALTRLGWTHLPLENVLIISLPGKGRPRRLSCGRRWLVTISRDILSLIVYTTCKAVGI